MFWHGLARKCGKGEGTIGRGIRVDFLQEPKTLEQIEDSLGAFVWGFLPAELSFPVSKPRGLALASLGFVCALVGQRGAAAVSQLEWGWEDGAT